MRLAVGSDHAGRRLRLEISQHLSEQGHEVVDLGTQGEQSVDYPDFAVSVAEAVAASKTDLGILVCGTGVGMSMAANRIPGVRAALCFNEFMARATRAHNDANVLCLGERVIGVDTALGIVDAFVAGQFEGGRHERRVAKINALDEPQ